MSANEAEIARLRKAYARRRQTYEPTDPVVLARRQELEREVARYLRQECRGKVDSLRLLEVGCGTGANIWMFLRLGVQPGGITANELLDDRLESLRRNVPSEVMIRPGDAMDLDWGDETFDVVFQSLVFSSLLDDSVRRSLATLLWRLVAPGGALLWYDFIYDNPGNADVRGVPIRMIRELFPEAELIVRRTTLAPPIARVVGRIHPALCSALSCLPPLRTHVFCWLRKSV